MPFDTPQCHAAPRDILLIGLVIGLFFTLILLAGYYGEKIANEHPEFAEKVMTYLEKHSQPPLWKQTIVLWIMIVIAMFVMCVVMVRYIT